MQYVRPPVATWCVGQACSMASLLLSAGTAGMRHSLPHARIMVHQPSGSAQGMFWKKFTCTHYSFGVMDVFRLVITFLQYQIESFINHRQKIVSDGIRTHDVMSHCHCSLPCDHGCLLSFSHDTLSAFLTSPCHWTTIKAPSHDYTCCEIHLSVEIRNLYFDGNGNELRETMCSKLTRG